MENVTCPFCGGRAVAIETPKSSIGSLLAFPRDRVAFAILVLLGLWNWIALVVVSFCVVLAYVLYRWHPLASTYRCEECQTLLTRSEVMKRRDSEV